MDEEKMKGLRARLDEMHKWPSLFMFKFILPNDPERIQTLKMIFGESAEFVAKASKKGNYTSVTVKEILLNADDVFDRYQRASTIEGIISL